MLILTNTKKNNKKLDKVIHIIMFKLESSLGDTYIEEHDISIRIPIVTIDPIESLRELHVADFLPRCGVHHETHGFTDCFAVVDVMITINIEKIRRI